MSPLPPETISEQTMREWVENYRPVRQRTVHSETPTDKAGALPPAVYWKTTNCVSKVNFSEESNEGDNNEEESDFPDTLTQSAVQITFVDEDKSKFARSTSSACAMGEIDEYDTDTDTDNDTDFNEVSESSVSRAFTTRSGRDVRACLWLDS